MLQLSQEQRTGYQGIRANIKVRTNAFVEEVRELVRFSPVLDTLTRGTSVSLSIETT